MADTCGQTRTTPTTGEVVCDQPWNHRGDHAGFVEGTNGARFRWSPSITLALLRLIFRRG